ncbi:cytochrome c-type biogenesis protein CcmH [Thiomicrorhabdus sp. HH1]|uniref:Cytochrome c-type biogenesis protein n=1 Tax=Thiomicrorhabdus heinhorstiae TaxID=2748010 RepID=A0ABS0BWR5_9GAMM|nr:cytochrome c-type biogenesis protein CcmH [Thiomicrorhabdus heinhorstiae]
MILLYMLLFSLPLFAAIEEHRFKTPQQERDYRQLIDELRCLVCQNQNLADSNAELAQDLRRQVYSMLVDQQADKQQVVDYMVQRYGDFVLYRPPLKTQTTLLWAGPFLFLAIGVWFLIRLIRRQNSMDDADDNS